VTDITITTNKRQHNGPWVSCPNYQSSDSCTCCLWSSEQFSLEHRAVHQTIQPQSITHNNRHKMCTRYTYKINRTI